MTGYKLKYEKYAYICEVARKLDHIWGMHHVSSQVGHEEMSLDYAYKWFGTKARIEIEGDKWDSSWLEITVGSDSPEQLDKTCGMLEKKIGMKPIKP